MKSFYCISGLGADQRVFTKLSIPGVTLKPIPWPDHDKYDDMACYAQKIAATIPEEKPSIIGVSFGGMLAVEVAKQIPTGKIFLISSVKTRSELPPFSGFLQWLGKSGIVPVGLLKNFHKQIFKQFGVSSEDGKELLGKILDDTDSSFVKWAMKALLNWHNEIVPGNVYHIHGDNDQIIPPALVKPDHWVEGGTHFMVYERADEISKVIAQQLG